jgi:MFS superfamily sulfate permease-like transporter
MFSKTDMSYGVNEVLLASVLGAVVFALFSAQPLVIVGVTGRVSLHVIGGTIANLNII